jgi:hypothetical protein
MRIRRVAEHAYGQQKQNRPAIPQAAFSRLLPVPLIGQLW